MANNSTSLYVRSDGKADIAEGAVTGAGKGMLAGAVIGSVIPGAGTVIGAQLGAVGGGVLGVASEVISTSQNNKVAQEKNTAPLEEVKAPGTWNREALIGVAGTIATGIAVSANPLVAIPAAIGVGFIGGNLGKGRMENEFKNARAEIAADNLSRGKQMAQNYHNTASLADIQKGSQGQGGFADQVRQQQQHQELAMAGGRQQ